MGLGERIRLKRESLGLTQAELGEKLGVGPNQIGAIESGRTAPSYKVFTSLAPVLGVSLDWLAYGDSGTATTKIKSYEHAKLVRLIDSIEETDIGVLLATAEAMQTRKLNMVAEAIPEYRKTGGN